VAPFKGGHNGEQRRGGGPAWERHEEGEVGEGPGAARVPAHSDKGGNH
jgi:hypothetical protein